MDTPVSSAPTDEAEAHVPTNDQPPVADAPAPVLDIPDLAGLEFLLDEIEDQIAPLA
jgi:hypothetical protein